MPDARLARLLLECSVRMEPAERENLKLLLGMAAGHLANLNGGRPQTIAAFNVVSSCLAQLQPHSHRVPSGGIVWHGRPSFLSNSFLEELKDESRSLRAKAIRHDEHFLSPGGPVASRLAVSNPLINLVQEHTGKITPNTIASYLYYDLPGQGICPHIDTDVFSLNALFVLQHSSIRQAESELFVWDSAGNPQLISMNPGDMVLFYADSVVHTRTPVSEGEQVSILTIGFRPVE